MPPACSGVVSPWWYSGDDASGLPRPRIAMVIQSSQTHEDSRADVRDRTGNLRFTRAVLYQLSYVGLRFASYRRSVRARPVAPASLQECNDATTLQRKSEDGAVRLTLT
ncbi:MAG: hypothetical protein JWN10_1058 [Solirubrobacterales bacterium]|jgi:hypothetical protein|nr:hypothetical protein [Solirubrobacterales bacterium]